MVGTGKAAQFGIFMKSGEALETASSIDTIVFDKTGTLTIGKPVVTDIAAKDEQKLLSIAASLEAGSRHPLATAILEKAREENISGSALTHIETHNGRGLSGIRMIRHGMREAAPFWSWQELPVMHMPHRSWPGCSREKQSYGSARLLIYMGLLPLQIS